MNRGLLHMFIQQLRGRQAVKKEHGQIILGVRQIGRGPLTVNRLPINTVRDARV